jgi:type II secretory pathway component PulF
LKTFEYQARKAGGGQVSGIISAPDELALDRELEAQGLYLTSAKTVSAAKSGGKVKLNSRELVTLTTQLSTLLAAGVPIVEGLRGLAPRMRTPGGREVVARLVDSIQAGRSLSESLDVFPDSFSKVYRASVRSGEFSGSLPKVLGNQASFLEWSAEIRSTTVQALFYPFMLMCAITGLVIVMITFVLPRIVGMMPGGEDSLPGPTRFLMQLSGFLTGNWIWILAGLAALSAGVWWALRQERFAVAVSRSLFSVPRLGELLGMLAVSRFSRTAATLQDAGCDMLRVLEVSGEACGNKAYAAAFTRARERVSGGDSLSDALQAESGMDPLLVQMTRVGEATGELDTCLGKLSSYYDKEVPRMVKWFLAMLEPAILISAGGVVAFILLAAILPMISLYENM